MNRLVITKKCIVMEIIGGVLCLIALILGAVQALTLSGPIPYHFGVDGEPNAWGSPVMSLLLPAIMLGVIGLVSLCMHLIPVEKWNNPFTIRAGHEIAVYQDFALMIAGLEPGLGAFALLNTIANWVNRSLFTRAIVIGLLVYMAACIITGLVKAARDNRG